MFDPDATSTEPAIATSYWAVLTRRSPRARSQPRPVLTEGTAVMVTLFELPATDGKRSPDEK